MRRRILALLFIPALLVGAATAQDEPASEWERRTQTLLRRASEERSTAETAAYRQEILALTDSLETAGELVLATHCLERAGILSYQEAQFEEALDVWRHGLDLARRSGDSKRIGALLNAQAIGVSATGDNVRAILLIRELIEFRRDSEDRRGEGVSLSNLAYSQIALFQYPEAIETLRAALTAHREAGNFHGVCHAQQMLSDLLARAGRRAESTALADSAVATARRIDSAQFLAQSLHNRALRRAGGGDADAALEDYDEAIELMRRHSLLTTMGAIRANRADALTTAGHSDEAIAELRDAEVEIENSMDPSHRVTAQGFLGRALLHAGEKVEARKVLEAGVRSFFALQDSLADEVQRSQANTVAVPLSVLPLLELREFRPEAGWRWVEMGLARQLRRSMAATDEIVSLEEFQKKLEDLGARALVIGVASSEGCPIFLVSADEVHGARLEFDAEFSDELQRTTELLAAAASEDLADALLRRIADRFAAAMPQLFAGEGRLVVMAGGLGGFPFELLPSELGALGDLYDISYSPSATVLISLEHRSVSEAGFVAFADPAPATAAGVEDALALRAADTPRPPLPQARAEAKAIAPEGGQVFSGAAATPNALRAEGTRNSVLHFATHASVDTQNPHGSALVLAPDTQHPSGLLGSDEIEGADVAANLVSLSGCSTVGGYVVLGEGTFGLVRAFLRAGSRSVVASRWDVDDAAARRFMEAFYEKLASGLARDSALNAARRSLRDEGIALRDCAAFALVGAVSGDLPALRAAPVDGPTLLIVGPAVVVVLVLVILVWRRATT